jgi:hypothetical protein
MVYSIVSPSSSSSSLPKHIPKGGRTMSLNRNVPYTSSTNPTTCSHLNVSQFSARDTIHMNSVRQVSMVDRDVAETVRVTDRPKKLNPLMTC